LKGCLICISGEFVGLYMHPLSYAVETDAHITFSFLTIFVWLARPASLAVNQSG